MENQQLHFEPRLKFLNRKMSQRVGIQWDDLLVHFYIFSSLVLRLLDHRQRMNTLNAEASILPGVVKNSNAHAKASLLAGKTGSPQKGQLLPVFHDSENLP
jgi:hypothetical protein